MSLYNYVDTPNANLVCCICRAPFTDPTTSLTCAHTFCGDCIQRALLHAPTCPVDRTPLRPADLVPANPIVRSLVDELVVECVYRADGCGYTAQRQVMAQHLRDECLYAEVGCEEDNECTERMRRKDLRRHARDMHGREDGQEEVEKKGKEKEETRTEAEETEETEQEETYSCPHASVGCPYNGPLSPLQHLPLCPYESLKGFFTANSAKVSLLTEQNVVLRHKVDMLESTVHTLRKEMNAAKKALGPWFRSSYLATNAPTSSGMRMGDYGSRTSGDVMEAGPSSAGDEAGGDALASYFPVEVGQRMMGGGAGGVVAPLDLGTSLEGTLGGLRESMVGLAAGVDSVGRRSEIALTNETLRMGEEMMSVRAQMHGLRMQVHGMMMDRNAAVSMREEGQFRSYGDRRRLPSCKDNEWVCNSN